MHLPHRQSCMADHMLGDTTEYLLMHAAMSKPHMISKSVLIESAIERSASPVDRGPASKYLDYALIP